MPLTFTENRQRNIGLSVSTNPRTVLRSNGIVEATQAEAVAGTIQHRYISPLRLDQVLDALGIGGAGDTVANAIAKYTDANGTLDDSGVLIDSSNNITISTAGDGILGPGPTTATAGSAMAYDWFWAGDSTDKTRLTGEAGTWAGKVFTGFGFSKTFDSSHDSASADLAPNVAMFALASNAGTNNDVVAVLGSANARSNNTAVFGGNFIARGEAALTGVKFNGVESDVAPAAGTTTASGCFGFGTNAFNVAVDGPAFISGGVSGGTFANGLVLGGLATAAAGVSPNGSAAMDSLLNSGAGTFTTAAAIFSNTHRIRFSGTAAAHAFLSNDSGNILRAVMGSGGFAVRNNADTTSYLFVSATGTTTLGIAGANSGQLDIAGSTSGTISVKVQAAAGTFNFNLPTSAGSSGQALLSGGGGSTAMSWTTGTLTLAGNFATSGTSALTLTTTGATNVTLPTTGTLATLAGSEELDNKTLDSSVAKGTWTASGTWTIPAVTLGGTVSGGGNQINNVIIGTSTPLAGSFTTLAASDNVTLTASAKAFRNIHTGTTQFTGPEFQLYNNNASMGNQAGAAFFSGIWDGSATQGYFDLYQINNGGSFVQTLARYGYHNDTWEFYAAGTARLSLNATTGLVCTLAETILSGTAIPAGGTAGAGYKFSSTSNFGVFFGSGAPTLSAAKGSLYLRSDGSSTSTRAYINTNGSTTWTAITTAA